MSLRAHIARDEGLKQALAVATQVAVLKDRIKVLEKTVERVQSEAGQIEKELKIKLEGLVFARWS